MTPLAADAVSVSGVAVLVDKAVDVGSSVGTGVTVAVAVGDACTVGKAGVGVDDPQPAIKTAVKTNAMALL
jgi:hypothetical protein